MRFAKFTYLDLLVLLGISFFIFELLINWTKYSQCSTPINYWLFIAYIGIILTRFLYVIIKTTGNPCVFKVCLVISVCIILPGLFSWGILGSLWYTINDKTTPNCVPEDLFPYLMIWWIGLCFFGGLIILGSLVIEILKYYRNRRRLARLQNAQETQDLFYEHLVTHGLLSNEELTHNKRVGLLKKEIAVLEKCSFNYTEKDKNLSANASGWSLIVGEKEFCSICLSGYQEKEKLCILPECKHIFHFPCLSQWLNKSPLCPYCKENVRPALLNKVNPKSP